MEQQRDEAVKAILVQDLGNARIDVQLGLHGLQRVALEEGIRTTLEKYKEYGVPPGETLIVTAVGNIGQCIDNSSEKIDKEEDRCQKQDGILLNLLCGLAATIDTIVEGLDCTGTEIVERFF